MLPQVKLKIENKILYITLIFLYSVTLTFLIHCSTLWVSLANPPGVEVQSPVLAKLQTPTTICLSSCQHYNFFVKGYKRIFIQNFPVLIIEDKEGASRVPATVAITWLVGTKMKTK